MESYRTNGLCDKGLQFLHEIILNEQHLGRVDGDQLGTLSGGSGTIIYSSMVSWVGGWVGGQLLAFGCADVSPKLDWLSTLLSRFPSVSGMLVFVLLLGFAIDGRWLLNRKRETKNKTRCFSSFPTYSAKLILIYQLKPNRPKQIQRTFTARSHSWGGAPSK